MEAAGLTYRISYRSSFIHVFTSRGKEEVIISCCDRFYLKSEDLDTFMSRIIKPLDLCILIHDLESSYMDYFITVIRDLCDCIPSAKRPCLCIYSGKSN